LNLLVRRLGENRATAMVVMVLSVLAATTVWNLFGPHADARLEAIRRQGYPVTLAELDRWYKRVPDKENNALIYEKVFALTNFGHFEDIDWPARDKELSVEDKKQLAELVATNEVALRLLHSAQSSRHSRYPVDLNKMLSKGFPGRFECFQGIRLLSAEAFLYADRGDSQQAAQSLLSAGRLADSVAEEPVLISQIIRIGCWGIIARRMERVVALTQMPDEQLASLQAMVAEAERPEALLCALVGERAMGLAAFNDLRYVFSEPELVDLLKDRFLIGLTKSAGIFEKDRAFYLDALEKSVAAASLPFPERLNLGAQVPTSLACAPRFSMVSPQVLPKMSGIFASEAETAVRLKAAQTALGLERFRHAHGGALPATLQELVPIYCQCVPLDPFDGAPLRLKTLDSGYLIYGNGMDTRNGGPLGFRMVWARDSSNGAVAQSGDKSATPKEPRQ
jgi:hypothetical protein